MSHLLLALLFIAPHALADNPAGPHGVPGVKAHGAATPLNRDLVAFCRNPAKAICGEDIEEESRRNARNTLAQKNEADLETALHAAEKVAYPKGIPNPDEFPITTAAQQKSYLAYLEKSYDGANQALFGRPGGETGADEIRRGLLAAASEKVAGKDGALMERKLSKLTFISSSADLKRELEFLRTDVEGVKDEDGKLVTGTDAITKEFLNEFQYACAPNLSAESAGHTLFPYLSKRDHRYHEWAFVIVCPAELVWARTGNPGKPRRGFLRQTLSQETANVMGSDYFEGLYGPYFACVAERKDVYGTSQLTEDRRPQVSAAYWSGGELSRDVGSLTNSPARYAFLREALEQYCDLKPNAFVPLGHDKIAMLGSHPELRATLGCGEYGPRVLCGLDGKVPPGTK